MAKQVGATLTQVRLDIGLQGRISSRQIGNADLDANGAPQG